MNVAESLGHTDLQKQCTIIAFICNTCAHMERVSEMQSNGSAYQGVDHVMKFRNQIQKPGHEKPEKQKKIVGLEGSQAAGGCIVQVCVRERERDGIHIENCRC